MATILIIDDHSTSRELLIEILGDRFDRVLEASDGREGLELARRERPDLIITDILMPAMDGFEFARLLRGEPSIAATPLIFYTASYLQSEALALARSCGAAHFLVKTAGADEIREVVDAVLAAPGVALAPNPSDEFDREHLRVMTDKLARNRNELEEEIVRRARIEEALQRALESERLAREKLEVALAKAQESDRLKSAFLANTSHEIRTPLNVIVGFTELLEAEFGRENAEATRPIFAGIKKSSGRLINTVHGFLDIAKLETGMFEYRPTPIRVRDLIEQKRDEFEPLAREKGLTLTLRIDEPTAVVSFDEYCLSRTLHHLLDNAIKFTAEGGVDVRLRRDGDGNLLLEIRDTGVGIETSYQARLFQPFSQAEVGYTRRFEGAGLGLALTKRFLELGNARISVENRKGKGTRFTIRFDKASEAEPSSFQPGRPPRETPRAADGRIGDQQIVLVVEDDASAQEFMRTLLRSRYRVLAVASGEEARSALAAHRDEIAVVLMDLSLKGPEDGLTLTRHIRETPELRDLPVIAVTAHVSAEDRQRCLEAGCDAYLGKPFGAGELFSLLRGFAPRAPSDG